MALPWLSPFQFPVSKLQFQPHKLKLSSFLSETAIPFPIRDKLDANQSLIYTFPINPRFPSLSPSLRCSSNTAISASESDDDSPSPSIFVKGLSKSTSEERLKKMFSEFGVVKQDETGESLGLAYIWFVRENFAQLAVKQMNGKFFDGRFISVTTPKGSSKRQKKVRPYKF